MSVAYTATLRPRASVASQEPSRCRKRHSTGPVTPGARTASPKKATARKTSLSPAPAARTKAAPAKKKPGPLR